MLSSSSFHLIIFQILSQCWAKMPTDRPTFDAIKDFLLETAPVVVKAHTVDRKLKEIRFYLFIKLTFLF